MDLVSSPARVSNTWDLHIHKPSSRDTEFSGQNVETLRYSCTLSGLVVSVAFLEVARPHAEKRWNVMERVECAPRYPIGRQLSCQPFEQRLTEGGDVVATSKPEGRS